MLADRVLASESDVDESTPGVAEIKVNGTCKLVGLLEDLSRRLKKLETATSTMAAEKRKNSARARTYDNRAPRAQYVPNVQAKPFVPNRQGSFTNHNEDSRQSVPPPNAQQNNATKPTDTVNAQVCYYHQAFGDKARLCSEPCLYYKTIGQREIANIESYPTKLLYVDDKRNKCKYLIDTGAAVSVLPKSCANRMSDAASLSLVAANNTTINTYGTSKRVVDVGLKRDYVGSWHRSVNVAFIPRFLDAGGRGWPPRFHTVVTCAHRAVCAALVLFLHFKRNTQRLRTCRSSLLLSP